MNNDILALRSHLFNTLAALQDKDNPMDLDRAKTICQVGDVIVDTAKTEIDFMRVNGSIETQFFQKPTPPAQLSEPAAKQAIEQKTTENNRATITVQGNVTTHIAK
jgi:uncharacterized protein (UPF0218 family)